MRYVVFVIVIAAAGVTAWLFRNDLPTLLADRGPPPAAAEAPPPPTVTVAQPLALELVEWDEFIGRFEAIERVDIRARVGGYLAEVPVADGATVAADDVLFVVDRFPFTLAVDRAQAQLDRAQANVEFASLELERTRGLIARNAASQAAFDERTLDLATAEAELADARAALGQAQLDLGFTTVRAPFPGRVSDRRVDIGNLIDTQTVLTTLVRTDPIEFEFEVTEDVLLAYRRAIADGTLPPLDREGSGAAVRLVDEADWPRPVTIRFVDNVVDVGSGTIRVQAVARNEDGLVLPGQFGTIRIPGSPEYEALLVPESAILSDQAQKILMTVDENGIVVPKPVRVGPREFGLRIIRAGLEPDDRIIVNGLLRARPGAPVNAEPGVIERWPGGAPGVLSN